VMGGHIAGSVWPLNTARCFHGRGRWSNVSACQLIIMRQCTPVWSRVLYGRTGGDDGAKWMWLQWGGVAPPTQEMRWAVVWAAQPWRISVRFVLEEALWLLVMVTQGDAV
jgi:hypothetical protein